MDNLMKNLKDLVLCDIETVVKRGEIAPGDYEALGQAVDIVKDIETIEAMKDYGEQPEEIRNMPGMSGAYRSGRMMPAYQNSWGNGMDMPYQNEMVYDNSYERGRSPVTGRYISRDDEIHAKLGNMLSNAKTEQERAIITKMMNEL